MRSPAEKWCREQGLDVFVRDTVREREASAANPAPTPVAAARPSRIELIGLEMTVARLIPQTFDERTVEDAREILGRTPDQRPLAVWINVASHLTERPDPFAFQTREGTVG